MTVADIVKEYLERNGFDGLCNPYLKCGCGIEDPYCCNCDDIIDCQPAYKHNCDKVETKNGYVDGKCPLDNCGECYRLDKPEAK